MANNNNSLTGQAIAKSFVFALLTLPTAITIFIAIEFKKLEAQVGEKTKHEIVCFAQDTCAIRIDDVWYKIDGIISNTIPDEYNLDGSDEELPTTESN